jgi:peptidoglycan/xylan/chitin deacetylase (PgdA/CDA1 family)
MVAGLQHVLRPAIGQHEIGMHGYHHELWGDRNWITRRVPAPPALRRHLLEQGVAAFRQAGLPAPRSFRAPNLTADRRTYALLRSFGFETDSSTPTQRGPFEHAAYDGIRIVPISVAPTPRVYRHPVLRLPTALHFFHFNFPNTVTSPMEEFRTRGDELFRWQRAHGRRRELVIYAHNWEFFDLRSTPPRVNGALAELVRRLDWLSEHYRARFYTMAEWAPLRDTPQGT